MTDPAEGPAPDKGAALLAHLRTPGGAALVLAAVALVLALIPYLRGPDAAFDAKAREYLMRNPEVIIEAVEGMETRRRAEAQAAAAKAVAEHRPALHADPRDPALGPPADQARLTVVQFFDYRCPFCKVVADDYIALSKEFPDVRFVFKEWPILDRGGPPVSEYAARMALAAHRQGRYLAVHDALMDAEALSVETVDAAVAAAGVDLARAKAWAQSAEADRQIEDVTKLAEAVGAQGTPHFVVGDRNHPFTGMAGLRAAIAGK